MSGPVLKGLQRGFRRRCPNCGEGRLFAGYLKINPTCPSCGHANGRYRADDAPPYFTMLIVGHVIVPAMLILEQMQQPAEWVQAALWLPLTVVMTLALLPRVKGAVIGFQWAQRIRG